MLFSTAIFIFIFLPCVLFGYYVVLRRSRNGQNIFLTFCSLFFYAWGEAWFVLVMIGSIIINWALALLGEKRRKGYKATILLALIINLSILFVFKYLTFILVNANYIFAGMGIQWLTNWEIPKIELPIGISFFTFQALSYTLDVCVGKHSARKTPLDVALYISFFPQLIAGPIVRYDTIAEQIHNRKETWKAFGEGTKRFIVGLGKKVLLANNLAIVTDAAFSADNRSTVFAWIGAFAYMFQIFYDFSGYSDMAIGLGKMFGFHFLENFNYPYISKSVSEFWRRWHISLGSWFRDYLYIPLGGSRVATKTRLIFNLFVVWFLTGVWHGANWTFILWGFMYFILIMMEKLSGFDKKIYKSKYCVDFRLLQIFGHIYTLFFVLIGWVLFRSDNILLAVQYIKDMFGGSDYIFRREVDFNMLRYSLVFIFFSILLSIPLKINYDSKIAKLIYPVVLGVVFFLSISALMNNQYNPFIYSNF